VNEISRVRINIGLDCKVVLVSGFEFAVFLTYNNQFALSQIDQRWWKRFELRSDSRRIASDGSRQQSPHHPP
jgi:hypothetical protein